MGKGIVKLGEGQWAVKDGNLLAAKETNGRFKNAEFTVARGTRATYVGRDGLIKESNLQDTNLVQNGDFEELGAEKVTNGDFSADSNWNGVGSNGWSIDTGTSTLNFTNASSYVFQGISTVSGKSYKVTLDIELNSGTIIVKSFAAQTVITVTSTGRQTLIGYFKEGDSNANFGIQASDSASGKVHSISVKEVDPNDRWTLGTGWSIEDGVAVASNSSANATQETFTIDAAKTYKIDFTISDYGGGTFFITFGGNDNSSNFTANGNYTVYITPTNRVNNIFYLRASGFTGKIDNVSVKEIKTDTPRIDFTNNTDGHLLLESQSTNYVTHSSDFSNSYFQKIRSTTLFNQIISPDGTQNADKFVEDSALTTKLLWTQDLTVSVGDTITWSLFAKKGERKWIYLRDAQAGNFTNWFDLENGVVGSSSSGSLTSSIQDMGNGWYRCSITYTSTTTTARGRIYTALSDNTEAYQGDGSSGVYIWGAQLEVSPYPTSYIPTNGSTVTRDGETCTGAGEAADFNSEEGVLYIETAALANSGTFRLISISDGTLNNEVTLYYRNNDDRITARLRSGSGSQVIFESFNLTATNFSKVAFRYKGGESNVFIDGVKQKASDYATTSMPVGLNSLQLSEGQPGNLPFYGKCKAIRVYKEALSDSELVTLTS